MAAKSRWDKSNWTEGPVTVPSALGIKGSFRYTAFQTSLANQVASETNAAAGPSGGSGGNVSLGSGSRVKQIYNGLISAGASQAQAIGLIANAMNEAGSNLDPEAIGDGGTSFGLWQFHEPGYPTAHTLVTGNVNDDIVRQIRFLVQVGGLRAASGATPEAVAGNFAANFERCVGCDAGGSQYNSRVANVAAVKKALGL